MYLSKYRQKNKRYTLVELLVTIAVITILAAMLITAMDVAKKGVNRLTCADNMGVIIESTILYTTDNAGNLPVGEPTNSQKNISWDTQLSEYFNRRLSPEDLKGHNIKGDYTENSYLWCPQIASDYGSAEASCADGCGEMTWLRTYASNSLRFWQKSSHETHGLIGRKKSRRLSMIDNASETIAFSEVYNLNKKYTQGLGWYSAIAKEVGINPMDNPEIIQEQHDGKVNLAFADGHVKLSDLQKTFEDDYAMWRYK